MRRPIAEKVFDPDAGVTHYSGISFIGNVTLCGQTDWLCNLEPAVYSPESDVDCRACISVVDHVQGHLFK